MSQPSAPQGKVSYSSAVSATATSARPKMAKGSSPPPPPPSAAGNSNGSSNGNGHSATAAVALGPDGFERQQHERALFAAMSLIGHKVLVRVRDRTVYEGIFHTATTDGGFGVVLQLAKVRTGSNGLPYGALPGDSAVVVAHQTPKTIVIQPSEFVSLEALGVDISYSERQSVTSTSESPSAESLGSGSFKTDTGISGFSGKLKERELVAWNAEEHQDTLVSLEDEKGAGKSWDQFSSNQKLFGVKSTFDEEIYTTKLDRTSDTYRKNERQAERLAAEIMQQTSGNFHRQEERGKEVDMDEESLYGAVIRGQQLPGATQKVYRPPQLRQDSAQESAARSTSSPVPKGTTPGSGEKKNPSSLPSTILNTDKNAVQPVQDVFPDVQRDMQKFSEKERSKISQRKQELIGEQQAEFKQFSDNLKLPQAGSTPKQPSPSPSPAAPAVTPSSSTEPVTAAPASNTTSLSSTSTPETSKSKLDPAAKEFKFNPTAKTFIPGAPISAATASAPAPASTPIKNDFFPPEKRRDITNGTPSKPFHVVTSEAVAMNGGYQDGTEQTAWQLIPEQQAFIPVVPTPEEFAAYAPYPMGMPAMYPPQPGYPSRYPPYQPPFYPPGSQPRGIMNIGPYPPAGFYGGRPSGGGGPAGYSYPRPPRQYQGRPHAASPQNDGQ